MYRTAYTATVLIATLAVVALSPGLALAHAQNSTASRSANNHPELRAVALHTSGTTPVLPDDRTNRVGPQSMQVPTIIVRSTPASGFSWADAAIGAAAMLGLAFLASAAFAGVRGHRRQVAA